MQETIALTMSFAAHGITRIDTDRFDNGGTQGAPYIAPVDEFRAITIAAMTPGVVEKTHHIAI